MVPLKVLFQPINDHLRAIWKSQILQNESLSQFSQKNDSFERKAVEI